MGSKISDILESKEINVEDLQGKTLAVDAFNTLYMFLTTIRGPDGSPLMDSKQRITSHLTGMFTRFSNYMEKGMNFIFVFDGKAPELKSEETKRRKKLKEEARQLYEEARQKEDTENMKKYAARTTFLTKEMIEEAKELASAMGFPVIQAISEGEAQAAHLVKNGEAYAVVSQDADALLNGSPRVIKNLSITGRRKKPRSYDYQTIYPELITLDDNLKSLNLTREKLLALAILVGTDYNYGGIKGIGPKKALKLLQENTVEKAFEKAKWNEKSDIEWKKIYNTIEEMPVHDDYSLEFKKPDYKKIKEILMDKDFNEERINKTLEKLQNAEKQRAQKGLGDFF